MHVLLTGGTGLLGRYLLRELLQRGVPVAVLVRPRSSESAQRRLAEVTGHWERELGRSLPGAVCVEGDICREGLGLAHEAGAWVASHCGAVLHNAASLTFFGKDRTRDPWLTNVTGTANLLAFCRRAGLSQLHHVSTAYVCGRHTQLALEEPPQAAAELRNDYERSKWEAERLARAAEFLERLTVYRPAVIVGDSRTGYTSSYHGLYSYLRFAWLCVQHQGPGPDGRYHLPARLNLTGAEPRNLVPVDWLAAVIVHILLHPAHHGRTYHLTPTRPVTTAELEEAMSEYFNYHGPVFAGPEALSGGGLNELEEVFYEYVARYEPYWSQEPTFDCGNTRAAAPHLPCPVIDRDCLHRLIDFAVRDRWGKGGREAKGPSGTSVPGAPGNRS
jgi:thioester reductase-like protein